jgi:hypothetical protein
MNIKKSLFLLALLTVVVVFSCKQEEVLDQNIDIVDNSLPTAAIGDLRPGGVVFWVDPDDNTHGLVCALSDFETTVAWGCFGTDLPSVPNVPFNGANPVGPGAEMGDGITNTNGILIDCPIAPAALAARSYGPEWFLPSAKELNEMYVNKAALEALPGFTPFESSFYWNSTEFNSGGAWGQNFISGGKGFNSKFATYFVRPIRAF